MINYGTNIGFWLWWAHLLLIIVPLGLWLLTDVIRICKISIAEMDEEELGEAQKKVVRLLWMGGAKAIFLFAAIAMLTTAFGPGKVQVVASPEDTGSFQMNKDAPEEGTLEEIKKQNKAKENEFLKKVKSKKSATEMEEEADDYILKAIERSKKTERKLQQ